MEHLQSHHVERRVRQRKTTATAPVLDKRTQLVTVYVCMILVTDWKQTVLQITVYEVLNNLCSISC